MVISSGKQVALHVTAEHFYHGIQPDRTNESDDKRVEDIKVGV